MTKLATVHSLSGSETPREAVRTVAELQRLISELQPQRQIEEALSLLRSGLESQQSAHLTALRRQIEEALSLLRSGLESQQSAHLTALRRQIEEALSLLRSGLESQQSAHKASLDRAETQLRSLTQALERQQSQRETQVQNLLKALETLTNKARTALDESQATSAMYQQETAAHWQAQTQDLTAALRLMAAERQRLTEAAQTAEQAAQSVRDWTWRGWALAVTIAAIVGLMTGFVAMDFWSQRRLQPQLDQMSLRLDQVLEQTQPVPTPEPRKPGKKP